MTRRSAILAVWFGSACVGSPPAPPQDDGTASEGPDSLTGTTASTPEPTTANDGTGSGSEDTAPSFDPVCGDGIVELPEECDTGELNGTGMYCTSECRANDCGDGYVGPGESCDDGNDSNEDLCSTECGPTTCGDGVLQGVEECDEGGSNATDAACLPSCVAASCGDAFVYVGVEACDGPNIGGATCESEGYDGGVLLCAGDCASFDFSGCYVCGNAVIEPGEACDGPDLNGETCMSQGFLEGTLGCAGCALDTSGCSTCGNGVAEATEGCDGADFGGQTCASVLGYGGYGGTLACNEMACSFDTSGCCLVLGEACMDDASCCSGQCSLMMDGCVP